MGLVDITDSMHLSQHKSKISMVELANIIAAIPNVDKRIRNGDPEVVNIIRYHGKESVATANTMLLLSRLYSYSSDKFFRFLKSKYFVASFESELVFALHEKSVDSIPDAMITQEGFKIVVETKLMDWLYSDWLSKIFRR